MALTQKEITEMKEHLDMCHKPIFYFDDDVDGLCSFLLFYRYKKEGKGHILKVAPVVKRQLARKAEEFGADKVFVLDKPMVSEEFREEIKTDLVWLDHHDPQEIHESHVKYYNPRVHDSKSRSPTTYWCHKIIDPKIESDENLWIAAVGCIGDWYLPDFWDEFCKRFPDLVDKKVTKPETAYFDTRLGELVRILSYILKGPTKEVYACVKVLTRIKDPEEILSQTSVKGKFIHKKYEKEKKEYDFIMDDILKKNKDTDKGGLLLYTYSDNQTSFTSDLSNEILFRFPKKVIVLGREKNEEMKLSLRSGSKYDLRSALKKALADVHGYGGGHKHACGANVAKRDFKRFVNILKKELKIK